tara:strand:- start:779 stop:1390 length:612 start_codon:yes stop_codon:yes gene_type:complete
MKKKIAIIDIGLGNIFSLYNSLKINFKDISIIKEMKNKCPYDLIIIPGVGTFKQAMQRIKLKFPFLINKNHKIKIIGICLGMHILYKKGYEEGACKGLGYLEGNVKKLKKKKLIIPNIGWRNIEVRNKKNIKFLNKYKNKSFYFCHSFHAVNKLKYLDLMFSNYDDNYIPSLVINKNIAGIQFHPEKSRDHGINLLKDIIHNL